MKKYISLIVSLALISSAVLLSGCGCKTSQSNYKVDLEMWGLFDDSDVFAKAINEYKKANPHVRDIKYKKLTVESYENDLRDALATGKGPDIFLIHNSWFTKHKDKLAPAPEQLLTPKNVQDIFADVVSQDFVSEQKVYALPLSVDSLALYYNKNLLNLAGIATPPRTWIEFDQAVVRLTKVDAFGNITISGAALGASSDASPGEGKINRATDILTLLMMQAGAAMFDSGVRAAKFAEFTDESLETFDRVPPGQNALGYFAKFSNRDSEFYSWNSRMHNSVDSFIEGKTAMMINYSWLVERIQSKAPKLSFGIAPVPQNIDASGAGISANFANYWAYAVSKNKVIGEKDELGKVLENPPTNDQRVFEVWRFTRWLTMPPQASPDIPQATPGYDPAAEYALTQKKPAARRDLVAAQASDPLLSSFVQGNLIARSWPQPDNLAVEKAFDEMIDDVVLRNEDPREAIQQAQNSVNLLIKRD